MMTEARKKRTGQVWTPSSIDDKLELLEQKVHGLIDLVAQIHTDLEKLKDPVVQSVKEPVTEVMDRVTNDKNRKNS